jgi:hypothetical protein
LTSHFKYYESIILTVIYITFASCLARHRVNLMTSHLCSCRDSESYTMHAHVILYVFIREYNSCKTDAIITVDIGGNYITFHYFLSFVQEHRASMKDRQRILFWSKAQTYATRCKVEGSRPDEVE